jgi:hypothetical protein
MSVTSQTRRAYSADVRMYLHVNGQTFIIAQLGPDFLILNEPVDQPPAKAEIAFSIDGRERRWPVQLPDGVIAGNRETRIAPCADGANGSTVG